MPGRQFGCQSEERGACGSVKVLQQIGRGRVDQEGLTPMAIKAPPRERTDLALCSCLN